ncbi:hypothetical protein BDZ89DRAFT_1155011 [Hymenopellis radicata]|nr:hypothetical protein BDZ89DRAFT_1155011 [Hymenopellis radicata]
MSQATMTTPPSPCVDSPSIRSFDTSSSLDLDQYFAHLNDISLFAESPSFDSISTLSADGSVPPFPLGCMVPISSIISVKEGHAGDLRATITVPTPPRLRTMLKENPSVKRWTESLILEANAPGHTPWGDLDIDEGAVWIPEGSLYSPDDFKTSLYSTRGTVDLSELSGQLPESPLRSQTSHRDSDLVFEREITVKTDGKAKRWSIQVPATTMNPEIVDIMLQLRELNTYFSESNTPIETIPEEEEEIVQPPSLMISNSQFAIPLSLDSTSNLESIPSTSLASRRQRSLAPLALGHSKLKDILYPDIPTAFMGNSSVYSAVDPTANTEPSSMNLQDMIGTLRSRCASLQVQTPATADLLAYQQAMSANTQTPGHPSGDEWAFANDLSKSFNSPGHLSNDAPPDLSFAVSNLLDDSLLDETLVATPILSEAFIEPRRPLSASPKVPPDPSYLPPSSPLPPCPAQSSPKSPRGILKRCKSVRFVSEDKETDSKPGIAQPVPVSAPVQGPRHSMGSVIPSGKRLPPIRHTYAPKCIVIPPQNMSPNKQPPAFLSAAGRQKPGGPIYAALASPPRAMSTPPSSDRRHTIAARSRSPTAARSKAGAEQRPSIPAPKMTRHSMMPASPQKARPTMTGVSQERTAVGAPVGKENAVKSSVRSTLLKSRFTMDENALRRGQDKDSPKSRVPMPLRNILTRFK